MAVRIKFDSSHNPIEPTIVLATRNGRKLGKLPVANLKFGNRLMGISEFFFKVNKSDCIRKDCMIVSSIFDSEHFWNQITDFKLIWVKEWDRWFEISVELSETSSIIKNCTAKSLGASELSQINIYGINVNNEADILRDDYEPTVLCNTNKPTASLLHRLLKKAPHYTIGHVDNSITNIQRSFQFDNITIYDAFQEISKEINCIISIDCISDKDGNIVRQINAYDLESYCLECGTRGDFSEYCDKCGSTNILPGYGDDTSIYVSVDNLAENITYKTDVDSVKNCFRLEGGDDLMTATIANCNPNGTNYIWLISDETKSDMSTELRNRLDSYDSLYEYYEKSYEIQFPDALFSKYNALVEKYKSILDSIKKLPSSIIGYPNLMKAYYDLVDLYYFLNNAMMPSIEPSDTTAELQAEKLNYAALSPVAVKDLENCSLSTANSAVLAVAKTIVDPRYQVRIKESVFSDNIWNGIFTIINLCDENDSANTASISCLLNSDFETFVTQRIIKYLNTNEDNTGETDVSGLFQLTYDDFVNEIKKYSLQRLNSFRDCCQGCLDILIQQGIANSDNWEGQNPDLYNLMYVPYYKKLEAIETEIIVRESEIAILIGKYDATGLTTEDGMQNYLDAERKHIQSILNFEDYLGDKLIAEFAAYRREDILKNSNYISDGLDNTELFALALEFIDTAKKEAVKSATLQHSIEASLKNLLLMHEFLPIVDYFELGNWIRVCVDSKVYKLRLIYYEIDFDNKEKIEIEFSDVQETSNYLNDTKKLLDQMSSMATSYGAVTRQAKKGSDGNSLLNTWVDRGLALTKMKIIDSAENQNITWDNHGLLCTEYLPITDNYDDRQLKIINRGLYLTDDNWRTSKAGIGDFVFWNPESKQFEEGYGVIADTLIGNLILGKKVGIYNATNSITMDENGFYLTADKADDSADQIAFAIQKRFRNDDGEDQISKIMYLDTNGDLVLNGSIRINTANSSNYETLNDLANMDKLNLTIQQAIYNESRIVRNEIEEKCQNVLDTALWTMKDYQAEIAQYMQFGENGLTLGSEMSSFKTIIDNKGMYFKNGEQTVSYISNNQLYINDAVINNSLVVGSFFFIPRQDGGVSLTWQGG